MKISRRDFLTASTMAGAGLLIQPKLNSANSWALSRRRRHRLAFLSRRSKGALLGGTLDPGLVPKYAADLLMPPVMPRSRVIPRRNAADIDYYEIAVRQFRQQILPPGMRMTTVWGYGSVNHHRSFSYPGYTIEAKANRSVRVKWINGLRDFDGRFLPHLFAVDPTLHWANPAGGESGRDTRPTFTTTPPPYAGPVPIVSHLHGSLSPQESDGYPEAWYLSAANDIPAGFANTGTYFDIFRQSSPLGATWNPGTAVFEYPNNQRATTLWYHDHALGMTRLNVYAGLAGFYLIRGGPDDLPEGVLPGPARCLGLGGHGRSYEIPIVIQDRSFNADGTLFYPGSRAYFDDFTGPYIPGSDISPIHNPEFFGNTIVVNGRTWPVLHVEPRRYRLRLLNGSGSRFLILKLATNPLAARPAEPALPFWVIGSDGGFLPSPVQLDQLLMAKAERADVIVDFSELKGFELYLINEGPDEPFGGGEVGVDFEAADPGTTGQVMKFVVDLPLCGPDTSVNPATDGLTLPAFQALGTATNTRRLSLNEEDSAVLPGVGPRAALLGTLDEYNMPVHKRWMDPITENPALGATEIWELHNFTEDAHPIHVHAVQFQVVNRQALATDADGVTTAPATPVGDPIAPESWESGYKDTVISYPGQFARIKARFDVPGRFVWHCHVLEHEDNEMMRPYKVGP